MNDMPSPAQDTTRRTGAREPWPRWLAGLLAVTLVLTAVHWLVLTQPVRFANGDDMLYQRVVDTHGGDEFSTAFAQNQGRFYYATPLYRHNWEIYRIANPWIFAALRIAFLALQFGLLAWLVARLTQSPVAGWLVLLAAPAALHLPTTYFAALSYPVKWVGFSALLGSLHFQLAGLDNRSRRAGLCSGLLLLLSALCLELFLCYLPLFVALAFQRCRETGAALRSLAPQVTVFVSYAFAYMLFSRLHPSSYEGTQLSLDIVEAANTLIRQTISIVPGFELIVHRTYLPGEGSWHKSLAELRAAATATPAFDYLLAALQAFTLVQLARRLPAPERFLRHLLTAAGLCILIPNLLISLTARYQVWAYHRQLPYIYGFYAYAAFIVSAVTLYWLISPQLTGTGWIPRLLSALAAAVCLGVFVSAKISNHTNLLLLRTWFN